MRRYKPALAKRPLVQSVEWKKKNSRSSVTKLVPTPCEPSTSSIATAPGKRARVGPGPDTLDETARISEGIEDVIADDFEPVQRAREQTTQNDYLLQYLERRDELLQSLYEAERGPSSRECSACRSADAAFRCMDCFGDEFRCAECTRNAHITSPFHRIRRWSGTHLQVAALWEVGLKICIGHGGLPCPNNDPYGPNFPGRKDAATPVEPIPDHATDSYGHDGPDNAEEIEAAWEDQLARLREELDEPDEELDEDMDIDDRPHTTIMDNLEYPTLQPKPPLSDSDDNPFLTVVDISDMQFMEVKLFPASYKRIRTVFTFAVMDDFRLENLECKVSAYQYYHKLRRLTNPTFPDAVPNRYAELRRLSRAWRNLRLRQRFGFSYTGDHSAPGSMALFCPACPQPGINMKPGWETEPDRELKGRTNMMDANFKSEHVRQKRTTVNVYLDPGKMYMTEERACQDHLKWATENAKQIATDAAAPPKCHRYHVLEDENKTMADCDITGHGISVCARHGFFCPNSGVNLQKGEKQMNMDWSLCQAVRSTHMEGVPWLANIYDVNCQYSVNLRLRVNRNPHLSLPDIPMKHAIGLFHVHGHQDECLYRYAPTYIRGMGMVDGEVLETLWSPLNQIFKSMRTAALPHRTEVFDDHKLDSNMKKLLNIAHTICKRYSRAVTEAEESRSDFVSLGEIAPQAQVAKWKVEIEEAEAARDAEVLRMDVMRNKLFKEITQKELQLMLMETESTTNGDIGVASWLVSGLEIEEEQILLARLGKRIANLESVDSQVDLAKRRQKLRLRISKFNTQARTFVGDKAVDLLAEFNSQRHVVILDADTNDNNPRAPERVPRRLGSDPECEHIPMPISLKAMFVSEQTGIAGHAALCDKEFELRKGQANDALRKIREDLSHLAWQFKKNVRLAKTTKQVTRSWSGVHALNRHWRDHRLIYLRARQRMVSWKTEAIVDIDYKMLTYEDCRVDTSAVSRENARGTRNRSLPWIWSASVVNLTDIDANADRTDAYVLEFYRLHWLRARSRADRWAEELKINGFEMDWVVRWFMQMASKWAAYSHTANRDVPGLYAYAIRIAAEWDEMGRVAETNFARVNPTYTRIWAPSSVPVVPVDDV